MVLLMLCLHLNSFAQHISMQLKNVTVKQAIETIQKQNGYSFTFAASDLNTQKIITVTARNLPIEKVVGHRHGQRHHQRDNENRCAFHRDFPSWYRY